MKVRVVVVRATVAAAAAGLGLLLAGGSAPGLPVQGNVSKAARGAYGRLPLAFEPNRGQADARVRYLARAGRATLLLGARETMLLLARSGRQSAALRLRLDGARTPSFEAESKLPGRVNYLLGNHRSRWRTNIPTYASLRERGVYPGIDLRFHGSGGRLEYDFLLAPGSDPGRIAFAFPGSRRPRLTTGGDLLLDIPGGTTLRQLRPRAFQDERPVPARFTLRQGRVSFTLGRYDHTRPLLIDPTIAYSTYLGGSGEDQGLGVAVDSAGAAYVTGFTRSADFPTSSPFQPTNDATFGTVFVSKLNPAGSALVYSTYLGGSLQDEGYGIAVDSLGAAYLTGFTLSSDFPTTVGAFQTTKGAAAAAAAFVSKLSAAGSALVYSTYLSSASGIVEGYGVAVDSVGAAYLTGLTNAIDFPTQNPFQATKGGGSDFDAYVSKLNAAGSALLYSSYLGGSGEDEGYGIAVDLTGAAYLTGRTTSTNFPTTVGSFQAAYGGGAHDVFVSKVSPAGIGLVYSSYLGGSSDEEGYGVAVDSAGAAYLTGRTTSTNFPTQNPFQATHGGGTYDAFVSKLNVAGSALAYSSYLGGSAIDEGYGIAVDSAGAAYLTGLTTSTNFPIYVPFQATFGGIVDAFVSKLNAAGSALAYSSYLGGSDGDVGNGVAVDSAGAAYLTGSTSSTNFPTRNPLQANGGGDLNDAFVTKLSDSTTAVALTSISARRSGQSVLVRWRTGSEAGLAGFELWRGGIRLNRSPIPAHGGAGGHAYTFRVHVRGQAHPARYRLVGVRLDGARIQLGSVDVR